MMNERLLHSAIAQSDAFKSELVAKNALVNASFGEALEDLMVYIQDKPFLSKKYLKGVRNSYIYQIMLGVDMFEAFIDVELDIKRMYFKEAEKEDELSRICAISEF